MMDVEAFKSNFEDYEVNFFDSHIGYYLSRKTIEIMMDVLDISFMNIAAHSTIQNGSNIKVVKIDTEGLLHNRLI